MTPLRFLRFLLAYLAADPAEAAAVVSHLAFLGIGATMDDARCPRVSVATLSQERLNELIDELRRRKAAGR